MVFGEGREDNQIGNRVIAVQAGEEVGHIRSDYVNSEGLNMGKKSRDKGAGAERELSRILNETYGFKTRRGDCFRYEPDVIGLDDIHVEVKRNEQISLTSWLRQAEKASKRFGTLPAVFHRRNREPWFVSMLQENFEGLHPSDVRLLAVTGRADPVMDCQGDHDGVIYFREIGSVVTMKLETWIGVYIERDQA